MATIATSTPGRNWLRANGRGLLMIAAVLLLWRAYAWWTSPEHRIHQFIGGVNGQRAGTLLALADPQEVERVQLTEAKLEGMLREVAGTPGGIWVGFVRWDELNEKQTPYNRWGEVQLQDGQGHPVTDYRGRPATLMIEAYNTDAGWKIGLTNFLVGVVVARHGLKGMAVRYWTLCRRHQVAASVFNPTDGDWFDLNPPPGFSLPPAKRS
jgi:hypothetical protein